LLAVRSLRSLLRGRRRVQQPEEVLEVAVRRTTRILGMVAQRIRFQTVQEWQKAFNQSGRGSTFVRAAVIADNIYAKAAPVPTVAPSPDRNKFLHDVIDAVIEAAGACGVILT